MKRFYSYITFTLLLVMGLIGDGPSDLFAHPHGSWGPIPLVSQGVGEVFLEDLEECEVPNATAPFPDDPLLPLQWHLVDPINGIHMEEAWNLLWDLDDEPGGAPDVIVAILDSGLTKVPGDDLEGTPIVNGYDFLECDEDPQDESRHGTQIASVIAQTTDNRRGGGGDRTRHLDHAGPCHEYQKIGR